jgi:hypothetical protein
MSIEREGGGLRRIETSPQTPARDHIQDTLIDGPDNLVRVPRLKHWEITGWFMSPQAAFDDLSPREYLEGKSWERRREVGIDALIRFKVLKP